jgi:hypothetical protein
LGIGLGTERGRLLETQTDYGYRWEQGYTDGSTGAQFWNLTDLLNNINRISVEQFLSPTANVVTNVILNNNGCYTSSTPPTITFSGGGGSGAAATATMTTTATSTCAGGFAVLSITINSGGSGYTSSPTVAFAGANQTAAPNAVAEIVTTGGTNNQTAINSTGTGAVVLNGSNGAGTGGVVIGSGGASESTVASVDSIGNENLWGQLNFFPGGTEAWELEPSISAFTIQNANATTPGRVFKAFVNAGTDIDSQGSSAVTINNTSTGGTGGFVVYEGGANSNTAAFTVTGSGATSQPGNSQIGSASGTGNVAIGNHLNQLATGDFAGHCTMSSGTSCIVAFQHSWTTPNCTATPQGTTPMYAAVSVSSNNVTVTANTSNSATWNVHCVGDPN